MEPMLALAAAICVVIGFFVGLLGGGGSVLMVPVLVYVAKFPAAEAIAMSLLIVGVSSAFGSVQYWKKGCVNRRLVVLFVVPGTVASFIGARAGAHFSSEALLFMFGLMMTLIALVLYRKSRERPRSEEALTCRPGLAVSASTGATIGFLTGLLGVGGGFLIVPAIALLMRCSLSTAIGTSLVVITLNSAAGLAGHLSDLRLDAPVAGALLAATLAGAVGGAALSGRSSPAALQKGFAALIFLLGIFLMVQNFTHGRG